MKKVLLFLLVPILLVCAGTYVGLKVFRKDGRAGAGYPTFLMTVFDANQATGTGRWLGVVEYKDIVCSLVGHNSPTATIKFVGSISEAPPASLTNPQSVTNTWDYVEVVDMEDGASIDGDTGIAFTGANDVRQLEVNTNLLKWFTAIVSPYTTGSTTMKCRPGNNL